MKKYIFVKVREGKGRGGKGREGKGRKEGREEGRKGGRKEARKGEREEGREGGRDPAAPQGLPLRSASSMNSILEGAFETFAVRAR